MPILGVVASSISGNLDPNAMYPIALFTANSSASSVTISSNLRIFTNIKTSRSAFTDPMFLRFNGDSGSNYSYTGTEGEGPSTMAGFNAQSQTSAFWGRGAGASNASLAGMGVIDIYNYANTNIKKSFISFSGIDYSSGGNIVNSIGTWENTAAISSITFFANPGPNITSNSTFQVYGMK
jgi:hypothetical protein